MKQLICLILIFIVLDDFSAYCQSNNDSYPVVGKACPNFIFNDIEHFTKNKASLQDFKGRWLILDFWTKGCKACVSSFPKINQFQKEFKSSVQFLLVAKNDQKYNKDIRLMYERFRDRYDLQLPIAYDTVIFSRFGIRTVPHIIIIDEKGIVRAVTSSADLNKKNIQTLLEGNDITFKKKSNVFEKVQETSIDWFFLNDEEQNEGKTVLYNSVLARWKREERLIGHGNINYKVNKGYYKGTGLTLTGLYNLAYLGKYDWHFGDSLYTTFSRFPIWELRDSSLVLGLQNNLYNYGLVVPLEKTSMRCLQEIMQTDLKRYFGYNVSIETRVLPYWKVVTTTDAVKEQLATKGGQRSYNGDHAGLKLTNYSINDFLRIIWSYHQRSRLILIDESGITDNVDVSIDAIFTELDDIRVSLQEIGLNLITGHREMKVLVIRDF